MKSKPARNASHSDAGGEKTTEQLEEDLRKTREELAIQKWGTEKTLGGMKVLVKELIQKGKEVEKFKLAVDNVSDQIIITDPDATVLYINDATEKITGYAQEEVVGKKAGKLWGNLMERSFYENLWKTIKIDKKIFIGEIMNQRKNNQTYTALISISPILDERGEIEFFVGIERDITKEKEIDKAKTEFASLTSHQLRTPLSAINWYVEMLLAGDVGTTTEKQKSYLNEIYHGNRRMVDLVNSLLNVSRIDLDTFVVESKQTDIVRFAQDVIRVVDAGRKESSTQIQESYAKDIPMLAIDRKLMRIVIENLLSNAIQYSPEKSVVEFSIQKKNDTVLITVTDHGYGIPANQRDKIFTKLFRADNILERSTEGTGLGLYIVKAIVEQSGGRVWFTSEENVGTSFFVSMPMHGMKKKGARSISYDVPFRS